LKNAFISIIKGTNLFETKINEEEQQDEENSDSLSQEIS
jgi:hypothetical protein